uniref:Glycerophosphodiester phosphodiesterase domain containing 2 n=1 Tax=Oryzias latipes TaxID=8090 RepID=A0A3P9J6R2_ORYLA
MPCCWLSFVAVVSLLSLSWLYICLISFNDQEELNATAPFLQFGAVAALTLISSFVFQAFHKNKTSLFAVVSAAIFLCPLLIQSPCFIELKDLPEKPKLIAHRGAPMLAPENTMMAFERSVTCGVMAFETDVQIKDRIPFLMHDNKNEFLLRTTNVKESFPERSITSNMDLTFEEIQNLNAGEWFLKKDPFWSVSQLSEEEKQTAKNQTVPSLLQLLELAKQHNISVIFDLYQTEKTSTDSGDTAAIVDTIQKSDINPGLILWLPPDRRKSVKETAPGFVHIYSNLSEMKINNDRHLNVKYSKLSMKRIELRADNITVNLWVVNERWLFSLLWCVGASSVTTNSCHLLKDVKQPDWFM